MVGEEHMVGRAGLRLAACLLMLLALPARGDMAAVLPVPDDPAAHLQLPEGFAAQVYARLPPAGGHYFSGPRFMAFGPDGHLYLTLGRDNRVLMLPDRDGDGRADEQVLVAERLNAPQGIAFVGDTLLVANQDGVVRLERGATGWPAARVTPLIRNLPAGGHTLKSLKLGPDGHLYLNVGSSCNVCVESDPLRATLLRYTVDGRPAGALPALGRHTGSPVWASGLRNSQGWDWAPDGELYASNNGSDMRSHIRGGRPDDDLPPEHVNRIVRGANYGWPHCWGERHPDPDFPGPQGFCENMTTPVFTLPAHTTPIGLGFLTRAQVPPAYRADALVALHGSWNRARPAGYKVVRLHFEHGKPVRASDFITGWLAAGGAWGRPVDIVVGPDGAIYVSDDRAGLVFRVTYQGNTP